MTSNFLSRARSILFTVLQLVAPEGSSLDAIFDSYGDWREMRRKSAEKRLARLAQQSLAEHAQANGGKPIGSR
jgi:hypothetical protein